MSRVFTLRGPVRQLDVECVEGNSLNTLLSVVPERITRFSDAFVLSVGAEVAQALHHAHTRTDDTGQPLGIVHRAVDLDRIWLSWSGQVKLTDFGLALSKLSGRIASTVQRPRGNAYYASPEALLGLPVDARSDLFQLGLALYELATGSHPMDPPEGVPTHVEERLSARQRQRLEEAIQTAKEAGLEGELVEEMRAQLNRLGAYGATEAAQELGQVLAQAGEQLLRLEGNGSPVQRRRSPDDVSTQP